MHQQDAESDDTMVAAAAADAAAVNDLASQGNLLKGIVILVGYGSICGLLRSSSNIFFFI